VALRAVTGEIAASSQDTTSWGLAAPLGWGTKERPPFGCRLESLGAGSVLSIQHLQKHCIVKRNRHLADLEIDLLSTVIRAEGFAADHIGKCL